MSGKGIAVGKWFFLFSSIFLAVVGQILLKRGSLTASAAYGNYLWNLVGSVHFWMGGACYGISLGLWLLALRNLDLGIARAYSAMGYPLVYFFSVIFFGEALTLRRGMAIGLIALGVLLLGK